jgi:hypothetical protein
MVMNPDGTMPTGTAVQSLDGGVTYTALNDTTAGYRIGAPLRVTGTAVPEPATTGLMLLGASVIAVRFVRARRRS